MKIPQNSTVTNQDNSETVDWATRGPTRQYPQQKPIDFRHHLLRISLMPVKHVQ